MNRNLLISIAVVFLLILIALAWLAFTNKEVVEAPVRETSPTEEIEPAETETAPVQKIIGTSVEGRVIESYTYGTGDTPVLFVGGVHGGYEWNSIALAYEFIAEIEQGLFTIPPKTKVVIIPNLNPDGLFLATGLEGKFTVNDVPENDAHQTGNGRFNAHRVDLNRNFDCKWQPESTWRSQVVKAGTSAFSEPEAVALRDTVLALNPAAVVFWHSQANTVYGSECLEGVLPGTLALMNAYAKAADYNSLASFTAYPVSGDAEGWLASLGIPAVTVELETRTSTEWSRNRAGILATLKLFEGTAVGI